MSRAAAPTARGERIAGLDVLRGLAILGIGLVNIELFATAWTDLVDLGRLLDDRAALARWAVTRVLLEHKFLAIFALLFGAGLSLQLERLGPRRRVVLVRRLAVLAVFGLAHGLLIWSGDILLMYAVVGLPLVWLADRSGRVLAIVGLACLALSLIIAVTGSARLAMATSADVREWKHREPLTLTLSPLEASGERGPRKDARASALASASAPASAPAPASAFLRALRASGRDPAHPAWREAETIAYREGPWTAAFTMRSIQLRSSLSTAARRGALLRIFGLMCLGAALRRGGFFAPPRPSWRAPLTASSLVIGLAFELAGTTLPAAARFGPGPALPVGLGLHLAGSTLLAIGIAGAVLRLTESGIAPRAAGALAAVGRTALSSYLAFSLLATAWMSWWGMARFGVCGPAEQYVVASVILLVIITAARGWLAHLAFGPAEWLWRCATYGRRFPIRRWTADPKAGGGRPTAI